MFQWNRAKHLQVAPSNNGSIQKILVVLSSIEVLVVLTFGPHDSVVLVALSSIEVQKVQCCISVVFTMLYWCSIEKLFG